MISDCQHEQSSAPVSTESISESLLEQMDRQPTLESIPSEDLLSALPWQAAVLDQDGMMLGVNDAWRRFARENGVPSLARNSFGIHYLELYQRAAGMSKEDASEAYMGIQAILDGERQTFRLDYPCHSPHALRWFNLTVSPLPGGQPGAMVQHLDITAHKLAALEREELLVREQAALATVEAQRRKMEEAQAQAEVARQRGEAALRLEQIQAVTDVALGHLSMCELVPALLERVRAVMAVDDVAILLRSEDGRELVVSTFSGPNEAVFEQMRVPVGEGILGRVATNREPLVIDDLSAVERVGPVLREHVRSLVAVPLLVEDRLIGILAVGTAEKRCFSENDVHLLELSANRIALALDHAQLYDLAQTAYYAAEKRASQLDAIIESMTDGVAVTDTMGQGARINRALAELLGLAQNEHLAGMSPKELGEILQLRDEYDQPLPPERCPFARIRRGEVLRGPTTMDLRLTTLTGREVEVTVGGAPIRDEQGNITGAVQTFHDVTERRRLMREHTERASQFEAMFEAMSDGVALYDAEGRIVGMNEAYRRLIRHALEREVSTSSMEEQAHSSEVEDLEGLLVQPDLWPLRRIFRGETLADKQAVDMRVRQPGGREMEVSLSGAPILDAAGHVVGAVTSLRDVTERRREQRRTREAFDGLLALAQALVGPPLSHGDTGVRAAMEIVAELALKVLGCDNVRILKLAPENETLQSLVAVGGTPALKRAWHAAYLQAPRLSDQFDPSVITRLRGDEVVIVQANPATEYSKRSWLIAPMRTHGRLVGLLRLDYGAQPHDYSEEEVAIARVAARIATLVLEQAKLQDERDEAVWEREEAKAREWASQEASRQMELFMAMANHEIRTPLTVIKGQLQLAERQLRLAPPERDIATLTSLSLREPLNAARRAASKLANLLDDLLQVSNAKAGKLAIHPELCDLVALIHEQLAEQRRLHPSRSIRAHLKGHKQLFITADALRIAEVLTNYLNNACKYSPQNRPIDIYMCVEDSSIRVSVRDRGPGIAPDDQAHIWERFYQVSTAKPQVGGEVGLGLGLYICQLIVEQHGGQVGVESAVGKGSTFWFTLPLNTPIG